MPSTIYSPDKENVMRVASLAAMAALVAGLFTAAIAAAVHERPAAVIIYLAGALIAALALVRMRMGVAIKPPAKLPAEPGAEVPEEVSALRRR